MTQRFSATASFATALALALPASSSFAQAANPDHAQKMHESLAQRFADADTNHDGQLTKQEAQGKMPMVYKHFDEIDSAHKGSVTLAEIEAFAKAHRQHGAPKSTS